MPMQLEATEGAFGRIRSDASSYAPLDPVTVLVDGRRGGDTTCVVRACDPGQRVYFERTVRLEGNAGQTSFTASAAPGNHYLYLIWPDTERSHSRYVNFRVEARSTIDSGDDDFDMILPLTQERLMLGRRAYETPRGPITGYISADTWHFDGVWLRDWIYALPAYQHWESAREMTCGLDRFLEMQEDDGMLPDGIERDGRTWRVGLESDVEYIMTLGVWRTWQATGDDAWMAGVLPRLERALTFIQSDAKHWDAGHRLVKRQHSCDTWDFDIDGANDRGESRHVIATCDQAGYYLAFEAMAQMHAHLGHAAEAASWRQHAEAYRRRAVELLWDGTKFQHHHHLDAIDHGDFDESQQLAMGNTWAITRGLADRAQAGRIVDEYRRRHAATGDAQPWWSLQPGYPDHLGYFRTRPFLSQGGYANGGLMPWVGGELCRGAFQSEREAYGIELLRRYADHLRRTGGCHVWYWPDGTPGFRTTNEVNYAGWGMGEWVHALFEGLAGVRDVSGQMREVEVSPRWVLTESGDVRCTMRYAASSACFAYRMRIDRDAGQVGVVFSGTGERVRWRVHVPGAWRPAAVTCDGDAASWTAESVEDGSYVLVESAVAGVHVLEIDCERG